MAKGFRFFQVDDPMSGVIRSAHGDLTWPAPLQPRGEKPRPGKWIEYEGDLKLCKSGLHAAPDIRSALDEAQGNTLGQVEYSGVGEKSTSKFVCRKMRILELYSDADVRSLGLMAAIQALPIFEKHVNGDARPRAAIQALGAWLLDPNEASAAARGAAWDAASAAASAAARGAARDAASAAARGAAWDAASAAASAAAWDAASAAAWDAARDAASAAARGAAWDAASAAASAAAWDAQKKLFTKMIVGLKSTRARVQFALSQLRPVEVEAVTS